MNVQLSEDELRVLIQALGQYEVEDIDESTDADDLSDKLMELLPDAQSAQPT